LGIGANRNKNGVFAACCANLGSEKLGRWAILGAVEPGNIMKTVSGTYQNGIVQLDEPLPEQDRQKVLITFLDEMPPLPADSASDESAWDQLTQLVQKSQVKSGVGDLAHQHDHYLYGTPKREI
jgi:hypothetical protein